MTNKAQTTLKSQDNRGIITIHGKEYITVARRVELAHEDKVFDELYTEILSQNPVTIRATVTIKGKKFTGISSVPTDTGKIIEKQNPYEVAETSAVGRALGFAGFGIIEGIASADEMHKSVINSAGSGRADVAEHVESRTSRQAGDMSEDVARKDWCSVHNKQMKERFRKDGGSWFDHRWQENGEWQKCNGKPELNEEEYVYPDELL